MDVNNLDLAELDDALFSDENLIDADDREPSTSPQNSLDGSSGFELKAEKEKKTMSSIQVFMSFVANGAAEKIISRECFQMWVSTRGQKVVYPEESFRRTLIAHIRGVYGRKPFPIEIERLLLEILRREDNPWERCFFDGKASSTNVQIGKRGFNKLGYHEQKKLNEDNENGSNILQGKKPPSKRKNSRASSSNPRIVQASDNVGPTTSSGTDNDPLLMPDNNNNVLLNGSVNLENVKEVQQRKKTMLDVLKASLEKYYSVEDLQKLLMSPTSKVGHQLISPAVAFFLNASETMNDPRFAYNFLLPPPELQFFRDDRPIGTFIFDNTIWSIIQADEICTVITGRDLNGLHLFQLVESPVESLIIASVGLEIVAKQGEIWYRARVLSADGKRIGLLLHSQRLSSSANIFCIRLQDQSEAYGSMLNTPFFL